MWGGGWLGERGVLDFAGGTVVHINAGVAALAFAIYLGKRKGWPREIAPPHNVPMVVLGASILWFGWFGFNPGSTLEATTFIAHVAVTTNLAAAAGAIAATAVAWMIFKKPDAAMAANGALAGLVGITAGTAFVESWAAIAIGFAAGALVVGSVLLIDRLGVDDPVGAVSVHGVCGAFGTLAVGLFAAPRLSGGTAGLFYGGGLSQLGVQALGVGAVLLWVVGASAVVFGIIKATVGLRVSEEEEIEGLDVTEHGMWGYPEVALGPTTGVATPDSIASARAGMAPTPAVAPRSVPDAT